MSSSRLFFVIVAASAWTASSAVRPAHAQDLGDLGLKVNLDLPIEADGGKTGDDEDPPEVVNFYGQNLEGDGFFYSVDRSGSMQDSGELPRAKQEISRNVSEFSNKTQFGIVFFAADISKFPSSGRPVEANPGMKSAAMSFISGIPGSSGSCMLQGLREALQFANLASVKRKVLVYVGDGGGTCMGSNEQTYLQQMVGQVTSQNYQRVQINCVGVLMGESRTMQENFMKQLCAANGGTYRRIN
jgi:hypothetical protein